MELHLQPRQSDAYLSQATEILYGGAAGGGKSHLMRVASIAWCIDIPGLQVYIFRRLSDDLTKNHMEGPNGFPFLLSEWIDSKDVKIKSKPDMIEFWNGSKIHLCHCQYEKDVIKYQGAEIHCLEENHRLKMADGSLKAISKVKVGDFVSTLQGPRAITWVGPRELKKCVEAKVQSIDGVKTQIQSENHKVLTPNGWVSYADIAYESHPSLTSESIENRSSRKYGEQFANEPQLSLRFLENQEVGRVRKSEFAQLSQGHQSELETFSCEAQQDQETDSELSLCDIQESRKPSLSFSFPVMLHEQFHGQEEVIFLSEYPRGESLCVLNEYKPEGFQSDCRLSVDFDDEHQSYPSSKNRDVVHKQADALEHSPMHSLLDDSGKAQKHNPLGQLSYAHPYTGEERIAEEGYRLGTCELTPCGEKWTIDIMVEGENHYITESGLVNKNCLMIDELTHFTERIYRYLRGRCRIAGIKLPERYRGLFPRIICGSNPGGIGHNWVKHTFVDPANPMDIARQLKTEGGMLRQYIPARLSDNPALLDTDPDYSDRLDGLGSPELVRAMKEGDWNIVAGGMFDDVWNQDKHVIKPFEIPASWRIDRSFDWGSSKPFSVGWWAESDGTNTKDGRSYPRSTVFRIAEWYGWNGKPNEGCRMLATEIARGILQREQEMGILSRVRSGPADSSIFDTQNGVCIADDMARIGVRWERADKGPGSRKNGFEFMRKMMKSSLAAPMEEPGLFIFDTCRHFIRTVPVLPRSERDPDDVDSDAEDHVVDESRYRLNMPKRTVSVKELKL